MPCGRFWGHNGLLFPYYTPVEGIGARGRVVVSAHLRQDVNSSLSPPDVSPLLCSRF